MQPTCHRRCVRKLGGDTPVVFCCIESLHFWGPYAGYYYAAGLVHIRKFLLVDTLPQSMESHKITLW